MRAYENSITINLHCCEEGNWQQEHVNKEQFSEFCQVIQNKIHFLLESFKKYKPSIKLLNKPTIE